MSLPGHHQPWPELGVLAVVFLGGIAGGLARYGLTETWPSGPAAFPWAVFAINTAGAFALSMLVVVLAAVPASPLLRPLLGTGVLGAFTTFSSVAVAVDRFAAAGRPGLALLYATGSVAAGLAAGRCGVLLGRAVGGWRGPDPEAPE